ncbi:hypothetical protein [Mycolicibacterium austroafricanum]|uniref:hypothetical protein n=1 Tax=Mycolicibacterium austroafricanum TaxID=39687 RepID=UPI001CA329CF|nr:hypothetical protein [Mycolicibacterium austroafricanum]QZT57897.1 hypothetical protein JN084_04605 [Mycolicibacterium austroafricanum]
MTGRATSLDHADRLLDGAYGLGARGPRIAALLARSALEDWLDEQNASWVQQASGFPTTRSKLVALEAIRGRQLAECAKRVWQGLSRAVHRHAYELQPSVTQVRHLIEAVRDLERQDC